MGNAGYNIDCPWNAPGCRPGRLCCDCWTTQQKATSHQAVPAPKKSCSLCGSHEFTVQSAQYGFCGACLRTHINLNANGKPGAFGSGTPRIFHK